MKIKNLSVVVITKNEESNIERCLASVDWVEDVVIYDSGSTDRTLELAKKMGARVFTGPWLGFGPSKRKVTEFSKNDWVLSLDADEEVTSELKREILQKLDTLHPEVGYLIPRRSWFIDRWIMHGGWFPDRQLRLFHKKYSMWNEEKIHEKVIAKSQDFFLNPMNHYVFKNISDQIETNNRYSGLLAEKLFLSGKKFNLFHFMTKPCVKFVECYFLKLGILDGWPGFVIAKNAGYSVFLKWAKLREFEIMNRVKKNE